MHFLKLIFTSTTLAFASASVIFTNTNFDGITNGKTFVITWTNATGPVRVLLGGQPDPVQIPQVTPATIADGLTGTSYPWVIEGFDYGTYYLALEDSADIVAYSPSFIIPGPHMSTPTYPPISGQSSTTYTGSASGQSTTSSTPLTATSTSNSSGSTSTSTTSLTTGLTTSTSGSSATNSPLTISSSTPLATTSISTSSSSSTASGLTPLSTNAASQYGLSLRILMLGLVAAISFN